MSKLVKDKKVINYKEAQKFAKVMLMSWKKLNQEESDSYVEQNFDDTWAKFTSEKKLGQIDFETASKFIKDLL